MSPVATVMMTPQAFISTYAPRLRTYGNALISPIIPPTTSATAGTRTTKRGTTAVNYAENELDEDDIFEDGESRRATGLHSRRQDPNMLGKDSQVVKLGKEIYHPVEVQGIWRDWMGRMRTHRWSDRQLHGPTALPLTLIPIRIDVDLQPFIPSPALPLPPDYVNMGINPALPAYRSPEQTPPYRLKDFFLWNLHESLITPDMFATTLVHELDLPAHVHSGITQEIASQIRKQLEEYAGVALHPLFHSSTNSSGKKIAQAAESRDQSHTPALTPRVTETNGGASPQKATPQVEVVAKALTPQPAQAEKTAELYNPDDTYRCIISLNINLQNKLYTDRFEWSLLHPPGFAEVFAKQTCIDLGLTGEWVSAIAHGIYEAVLRLKKEACESGGLVGNINGYGGEIENMAAGEAGAGWRYDHETLGAEWQPTIETLSREEIEKKEGDRERELRRMRRETARFSSTANMLGGMPEQKIVDEEPQALGRGERAKKKRRFRSLSPQGRGTPEVGAAGFGGTGSGVLADWERQHWFCAHCLMTGYNVWGVRDGPRGPRTLCNNCGLVYERDKRLPPLSKNLHWMPGMTGR